MTPLRILVGLIVTAIVAVTLLPLLVLVDLASGGTGWGLCREGLPSCRTSYFDGFELLAMLMIIVFLLLGLLRITLRAQRHWERSRQREGAEPPSVRGGRRGGA